LYIDNIIVTLRFEKMKTEAKKLYAVIRDIRLCFNLLRARADEMHKDLGVSASMRAVMESLAGGDEKTVPEIARSRGVSRQHIQVIVNGLTKAKLIEARDNPDDKRTFLISLTDTGRVAFYEIQKREALELRRLSEGFSTDELNATLNTLQKLSDTMRGTENE
jgi:DNA-binding MarR family transcriptional regulator